MTPHEEAQAEQLEQRFNEKAGRFLLDPASGYREGYQPSPTIIRNDNLLSAELGPRVDSQVLLSDWLEAIARKDLTAWLWRIDHAVMPRELVITGRR
jgi:hypothetical protein